VRIAKVSISRHVGPFRWCFVKVENDEGLVGYGEAPLGTSPSPGEIERVRSVLVGQDPTNIEFLVYSLQRQTGASLSSGLELALHDLVGKYLGVPIFVLLGGRYRDRIRMYSDSHAGIDWDPVGFQNRVDEVERNRQRLSVYSPQAFADHARQVVAQGFSAVKFDIDFPTPSRYELVDRSIGPAELREIVDVVAAIREAIGPDVDLAVDCHARYNVADALRIAYEVEPFKLMWLEDPVPPHNIEAMAKVTNKSRVPICTGEALHGRDGFRELVVKQAADIIQPDTPRAGGLREIKRIAELAEIYDVSVGPHNMTSPIGTLAAVHLCASVPNFLALEFHCGGIPWWEGIVSAQKPILSGGYIKVPEGPGLGAVLDEAVAQEHAADSLWM
jgi:L-alanine-DL-glutamate epimerase-like enolase superfamily enzyme